MPAERMLFQYPIAILIICVVAAAALSTFWEWYRKRNTISLFAPDPLNILPVIKHYKSLNTVEDVIPASKTEGLTQKRIGAIVKKHLLQYQPYSDDMIGRVVNAHVKKLPTMILEEMDAVSKFSDDPLGLKHGLHKNR